MTRGKWKTTDKLFHLFHSVGRASLLYDVQDSHSGNMAVRFRDEKGEEIMAVTAAGSQKGDLERDQICFLSLGETDFGYFRASSETDIHAQILNLEGVGASIHAHTKELVIATLDDRPKPGKPDPFIPVDPLGYHHLGGMIPVDWVAVPTGSPEMMRIIPERLSRHPVTVIQGHGAFSRGRSLKEAFFLACVANNSGAIVRLMERFKIDVEALRRKVQSDASQCFSHPPPEYVVEGDERCDFPDEEEILREFFKAGARLFESRLSPFHTGSLSVRGVDTLLLAPKASMPREIGGPLLQVPLAPDPSDPPELKVHKAIYAGSHFQAVIHCYLPEAEAHSHFVYPGEKESSDRIVPVDAEGSFHYLVIPVVPPDVEIKKLIHLLHDYKVIVVRGGGVWAVGAHSISEVLFHPSSVREICLYRIGALERGFDLRKMEPEKAGRW